MRDLQLGSRGFRSGFDLEIQKHGFSDEEEEEAAEKRAILFLLERLFFY